jgi:hypothetical protein
MSRPKFHNSHKGFSGMVDDLMYRMYNSNEFCLAGKFVKPTPTANTLLMKTISKNLSAVYNSAQAAYKADLKTYSRKYKLLIDKKAQLPPNSKSLFIKMLWAWRKVNPVENDLTVVTAEDIIDKNAPCKSVKDAVDAGYLPHVAGYETLTNLIA